MERSIRYQLNAEDCRRMARETASLEHRQTLLRMAVEWDALSVRVGSGPLERALAVSPLS
jgi:hypothetical protein